MSTRPRREWRGHLLTEDEMRHLLNLGVTLTLLLALTACPPSESGEDGGGERDAGSGDSSTPDSASPDTTASDTSSPDTTQPPTCVDDAGPAPLTEQQWLPDLAGSAVASASWALPAQHGTEVCGLEVVRLEGGDLVFYDRAALAGGEVIVLQRLSLATLAAEDGGVPDSGLTTDIAGISVAFDPSTCNTLLFSYATPEYSAGLGLATRAQDGSWGVDQLLPNAILTVSDFPIVAAEGGAGDEDGGSGAPEVVFVVVDDWMGHALRVRVTDGQIVVDGDAPMTTAGCSGVPQSIFLGAPHPLEGSYVAVAYTGSYGTDDEGAGGFVILDVADTTGEACEAHIALPPGDREDSHVAVGGLALRQGDLVVAWDHYGTGIPAPRYPSKLLRYERVGVEVELAPAGEAPLFATWPSGVFHVGEQRVLVVETPPTCAFTVELFGAALEFEGRLLGPDATTYYQPFKSVAFPLTGETLQLPIWLSLPDGMGLYAED